MTSTERVKLHRMNKLAAEFAKDYLESAEIASIPDFIEAKKYQISDEHNCGDVSICHGSINRFYEQMSDFEQADNDGRYTIIDLWVAWEQGMKPYQEVSTVVERGDISTTQVQGVHDHISDLIKKGIDMPELHFIIVGIIRAMTNGIDMELINEMIELGKKQGENLK